MWVRPANSPRRSARRGRRHGRFPAGRVHLAAGGPARRERPGDRQGAGRSRRRRACSRSGGGCSSRATGTISRRLRFYRRLGFVAGGPPSRSGPAGSRGASAAQGRAARTRREQGIGGGHEISGPAARGRVPIGAFMIGEQFGNYRAIALLGEGGMGAVYLAEHPGIGRRVAVKVLHKNYIRDEQLLARFLNEARAANAIRHPNIIEILDSGVHRRRHAVPGDGAARGGEPGHAAAPAGALADRDGDRLRLPDRVGAGRRAREGDRPPRSQARQPVRHPRSARRRSASGSRCSTSASRSCSRDRSSDSVKTRTGHADGDADLHVARAVPRHAHASITAATSIRWA